jgi:hypothetical protein
LGVRPVARSTRTRSTRSSLSMAGIVHGPVGAVKARTVRPVSQSRPTSRGSSRAGAGWVECRRASGVRAVRHLRPGRSAAGRRARRVGRWAGPGRARPGAAGGRGIAAAAGPRAAAAARVGPAGAAGTGRRRGQRLGGRLVGRGGDRCRAAGPATIEAGDGEGAEPHVPGAPGASRQLPPRLGPEDQPAAAGGAAEPGWPSPPLVAEVMGRAGRAGDRWRGHAAPPGRARGLAR